MDKLTKIKKLGSGINGTVWLVKNPAGKLFALKSQPILKSSTVKSLKSPLWREIKFSNDMSDYPDQFTHLYDYKIIPNCKDGHKIPDDITAFDKRLKRLSMSKYCAEMLYEYKEGDTLDKVVYNLKQNEIYAMLIQLCNIINIMKNKGYTHNDLHGGNIIRVATNKKIIIINGYDVPTFGYIYCAIDYGMVTSKVVQNKSQDLYSIIGYMINNNMMYEYTLKHKIVPPDYYESRKILAKSPEFKQIKRVVKLTNYNEPVITFLFLIIYPDFYNDALSGIKKRFPVTYLIPKADILYMIMNSGNVDKIIGHLIKSAEF